jgi:hypothetical protein
MNAPSSRSFKYAKGLQLPRAIALAALLIAGAIAVFAVIQSGRVSTTSTRSVESLQSRTVTESAAQASKPSTHVYVVSSEAEAEQLRAGIRDAEMEAWSRGDSSQAWLGRAVVVVIDSAGSEQIFAGEMAAVMQNPSSGAIVIEDLRRAR